VHVRRIAGTLPQDGGPRLERLRGFGTSFGRALTCLCSRISLPDRGAAVLVVSTEPIGAELPAGERVRRLIASIEAPVALFSPQGELLAATDAARARIGGRTSLSSLGAAALAQRAIAERSAAGDSDAGALQVDTLGEDSARMLLVTFESSAEQAAPAEGTSAAAPAAASSAGEQNAPVPQPGDVADASADSAGLAPAPPAVHAGAPTEAEPPSAESPPIAPAPPRAADRRHPLRFVWQIDAEERFTLTSGEFIELAGARTAALQGQPWADVAATLGLDADGQVARALASRDTWSGIVVRWPADGGDQTLPIELSGLPVFDRDRTFRGYRGFGVCRDLDRIAALAQLRRFAPAAGPGPAAQPAEETATPRQERPVLSLVPQAKNVVPFPAAPAAPTLSPVERKAFNELASRLAARLKEPAEQEAPGPAERPQPVQVDEPPPAAAPKAILQPLEEDSPVAEPMPAEGEGAVRAEHSGGPEILSDHRILDRLATGILVYRLNTLLYANAAFLAWSGHASLDGLTEAGGLDSLLIEPASEEADGVTFLAVAPSSEAAPQQARLFTAAWDGEDAHVLALAPAAPAQAAPAQAGGEALRAAEAAAEELRIILDTATDGVLLLDRDGRIVSASRSAQALFGYDAGDVGGMPFSELFAPESQRVASDYFESLKHDGVAAALNDGREVTGKVRQGGSLRLFMTIGRIGESSEKFCAVLRDISQWKMAEDDLRQAKQQAERASSAKSEFLARISHEIRTPLNAIIGFSEVMMEERLGPLGNERYREYLRDIRASGGHLLSLVNDLLDLSKIEAGKLELTFDRVNLNDLTQQSVAIMHSQANREKIIIRMALAPSVPPIVADPRSVRQIVLNLLSNAIKFTEAGGQVIVSTALNDDGEVVLRVRDTGIGMSEKDIATALEPFRQLPTSNRAARAGTGLGLPLTKALAEANRARFGITSALNAGTLVEIAFPPTRVLA
jgi:PAS domain S-box-containing protein